MSADEILVCVSDDIGIRTWLERCLQGEWHIEFVGSSDLSRISRLVEAARTRMVMVAADDADPERALRVIRFIASSDEELAVVGLVRRVSQDFLLRSMRAGARDCFIASSDGEEARDRIRELLAHTPSLARAGGGHAQNRIVLVTGARSVVDSRFFAQNLVFNTHFFHPDEQILGLDTASDDRHAFYLDSNNRLALQDLIRNPESLDSALIETALEEYLPGLRFLAGQLSIGQDGDQENTDLFIALSQLSGLFDRIIVNVDAAVADFWINTVGIRAAELVMVMHPIVEQAHEARRRLDSWKERLAPDCRVSFLLDGYEKKGVPPVGDLEKAVGVPILGTLPLDWGTRMMAMNAGLPLHRLPGKSAYQKALQKILQERVARETERSGEGERRVAKA
ncbi:CpaE family protein [Marinobacter koreensis]|uniref:CpaE family protein n=1 Tax=Marinobacter koreensis TaxID=335974 RepID=A0ABW0RQY2_9GAMM|nr:hypothetical protein [Marinobacter koreensis]MCK7548859.1 hypothetical protein [Marinobacter koreensis]